MTNNLNNRFATPVAILLDVPAVGVKRDQAEFFSNQFKEKGFFCGMKSTVVFWKRCKCCEKTTLRNRPHKMHLLLFFLHEKNLKCMSCQAQWCLHSTKFKESATGRDQAMYMRIQTERGSE